MKEEKREAASKVLAAIQDHFATHRAMPSFADVARAVGISVSTVAFHVDVLKERRLLGATTTGRLTPGSGFFQRSVVSSVRAGMPALVDESAPEPLLIDEYLIDTPSRTFLLTVKGESMVEAGLLPGDIVVDKRGVIANPGDIVVVNANGEGTIKELAQDADGDLFLRARNPAYPDIEMADGFEVMGVVTGQFRQYPRAKARHRGPKAGNLKPPSLLNTGSSCVFPNATKSEKEAGDQPQGTVAVLNSRSRPS
ncbi:MAG: LexA family protein [Hydrogenophaga sp.]|uniref:LexA family protein n=1 Tax=Hydrogenophaga sp. TaxID=1904254 RepID=UPI004036E2A9